MHTVQKYLSEYAQMNLIETEKQAQLLDRLLQDYPFLDPLFITDGEHPSIYLSVHALRQGTQHKQHVFDIHVSNMILTNEQQHVLDNILQNPIGLHVLTSTPGSGKTFFVKYLAQHFQLLQKNILICATTGAAALRLSPTASTAHTLF